MRSPNDKSSCPRCETRNSPERKRCTRCGLDLWCDWSPALYDHPLTLVSLGRSRRAQLTGNSLVALTIGALLTGALLTEREPLLSTKTVVPLIPIALGTYNVWAFTHGHSVSLGESGTDEAVISKTNARVVTVSISAVLVVFGWVLLTW
jgi:hypothetical protein